MNARLRNSFKRVIGVVLLARSKAKEIRNLFCSPEGANYHAENQHSPIKKNNNNKKKATSLLQHLLKVRSAKREVAGLLLCWQEKDLGMWHTNSSSRAWKLYLNSEAASNFQVVFLPLDLCPLTFFPLPVDHTFSVQRFTLFGRFSGISLIRLERLRSSSSFQFEPKTGSNWCCPSNKIPQEEEKEATVMELLHRSQRECSGSGYSFIRTGCQRTNNGTDSFPRW